MPLSPGVHLGACDLLGRPGPAFARPVVGGLRQGCADAWVTQPPVREPYKGTEWARGLTELHDALVTNRRQRPTGEQAAHVVEVIAGIHTAAREGRIVDVTSHFDVPEPMDWAK